MLPSQVPGTRVGLDVRHQSFLAGMERWHSLDSGNTPGQTWGARTRGRRMKQGGGGGRGGCACDGHSRESKFIPLLLGGIRTLEPDPSITPPPALCSGFSGTISSSVMMPTYFSFHLQDMGKPACPSFWAIWENWTHNPSTNSVFNVNLCHFCTFRFWLRTVSPSFQSCTEIIR